MIDIKCGGCLELMQEIPSGSVDLILCDLPYGTVKGLKIDGWSHKSTEWDVRLDTEQIFKQYERVLRMNGVAILFSQEPYTSQLRTFKSENFLFLYPLVWKKNNFANYFSCKKAPVSYFEDLSVFAKKYDKNNLHPLRKYFDDILSSLNKTYREVNKILGHRKAEHCFYTKTSQFGLCTKSVYDELISKFNINEMPSFKSYDELERINRTFNRTFNLPENKKYFSNVLEFSKEHKSYHPTQKPTALLELLIKTYTNEGDLVLDNCMGSGSTGVACARTKRNFIGYELDKNYFETAKNRINEACERRLFERKTHD